MVGKKRGILEGLVPGTLWAWSRTHQSQSDFLPQLGKLRSRKVKGGPQPSLLVSFLHLPIITFLHHPIQQSGGKTAPVLRLWEGPRVGPIPRAPDLPPQRTW